MDGDWGVPIPTEEYRLGDQEGGMIYQNDYADQEVPVGIDQ